MPHVYRLELNEPGARPRVLAVEHEVEVGRECDGIVLNDPTASRRHVRLQPTDAGLVVTDLGGINGTVVDGTEISEPVLVGPGAQLVVGETAIVVHPGREGDRHAVELDEDQAVVERASDSRKELSQRAARTDRLKPIIRPSESGNR